MNIWKEIRYSPFRLSNIFYNIRLFFRKIKWSYQRITIGFCDYDVYSLDTYLSNLLGTSIKHLSDTAHGYPGNEKFDSSDRWTVYLNTMSECFLTYNKDIPNSVSDKLEDYLKSCKDLSEEIRTETRSKVWQEYFEEEKQIEEFKLNNIKKGLEMLSEVFPNLWD